MRAFWGIGTNVGDTLTPVILEYFTRHKAGWVSSIDSNKLLLCGSILEFARPGDTVLGAGHYRYEQIDLSGVDVRALRGQHSGEAPVYGDPAILLPLIYSPTIQKVRKIGVVPHLWEQKAQTGDYIDVNLPWREFVDKILECETIISTSLHGFILAQVYGVNSIWKESLIVPGARIKYEDYMIGVSEGIEKSQTGLIKALGSL